LLDHHLPGGHLLAVAILAVKFIPDVQKLFRAEFLQAIAQRSVLLNIN